MSSVDQAVSTAQPLSSPVEAREVLIVGGGIAGIEALIALAKLGSGRLRLQLVAAHPAFTLRPQTLGEPWGGAPLSIDLERLCRAFGAGFSVGNVVGVDPGVRRVHLSSGEVVGYERLLLAPGARPALPFASTRVLGFGLLPHALVTGLRGSVAIIVPAGTSWTLPAYELALLSAGAGRDVRVVTAEAVAMEAFGPGTHSAVRSLLERHAIEVEAGRALEIGSDVSDLADTVISLPLLSGPVIAGIQSDREGFVQVDHRMAVLGTECVHAAGDATDGAVKQGGLAAQQADTAASEIVRSCGGDLPSIAYEPVLRGKLLAPDGEQLHLQRSLHDSDPGQASREPLWHPPGIVCASRLTHWLAFRRGGLEEYTLDHVARPIVGGAPVQSGARP